MIGNSIIAYPNKNNNRILMIFLKCEKDFFGVYGQAMERGSFIVHLSDLAHKKTRRHVDVTRKKWYNNIGVKECDSHGSQS